MNDNFVFYLKTMLTCTNGKARLLAKSWEDNLRYTEISCFTV